MTVSHAVVTLAAVLFCPVPKLKLNQGRAIEAPLIRRLFSSSRLDPRSHVLLQVYEAPDPA